MLVIQQNYGKGYECTVSTIASGLGLNAIIIYIQSHFWEIEMFCTLDLIYTGLLE